MIVVDASTWVLALAGAGAVGSAAREVLAADPDWAAPAHSALEVLRTLRRYESNGVLAPASTVRFAAEVIQAEVRYAGPDPWLLTYVWQHRHNLSSYDAPYVGLADRYGVRLVSNDLRLARAAGSLGVTVEVPGTKD